MTPVPMINAGAVRAFLVLLLLAVLSACKSGPKGAPPATIPSYLEIAEAHNQRLAHLQTIYASGIVEIRWRDQKGRHVEQGNLELWLHLPRRTALRVEKLGETLLWLGSDAEQTWLFDLVNEEKLLHLGRHDDVIANQQGIMNITPATLLDLMGLGPLPTEGDLPQVQYDRQYDAWMIQAPGSDGRLHVYFDRRMVLPLRVESLAADGGVAFFSDLRRYESVRVEGMPVAAYPRLPHLIETNSASFDGGDRGIKAANVKMAITNSTTAVEPQQLSRVFDLERLKQALRPARIQP